MAIGWIEDGLVKIMVDKTSVRIDVYDDSEEKYDPSTGFHKYKHLFRFCAYGEIYGGQRERGVYVKLGSFVEHPWRIGHKGGELTVDRKSTHGNSKLINLAEVCKGFVEIVEKTALEYDQPGVQSFLTMMAQGSIDLLDKKTKHDLGIK